MAENSLLGKLDGLVSRFEEVGTLITDPAVIADMKRFVKLNKEYRDLEKIVGARSGYLQRTYSRFGRRDKIIARSR